MQIEQQLGPAASWDKEYWFQRVLLSKYNSKGAAAAVLKQLAQQPPLPPWRVLYCYHRLLRNAIAHEFDGELQVKPTQPMPPFTADDVDLVVSWPMTSSLQVTVFVLQPVVSAAQSAARLSRTPSSSSTASSTTSTNSAPSSAAYLSGSEPSMQSSIMAPGGGGPSGPSSGSPGLAPGKPAQKRRRKMKISSVMASPQPVHAECGVYGALLSRSSWLHSRTPLGRSSLARSPCIRVSCQALRPACALTAFRLSLL